MTTKLSSSIFSRDIDLIRAALVAGEDANQSFAHHDSESDLYDDGAISPALIWATKLRLPEAIKLLLEAGANPDAQDKRGRNSLSILCNWTAEWEKTAKHDNVSPNAHRLEVIQLLKRYNCNPNLPDESDNNALHSCMGNFCFSYGEFDAELGKDVPDEEAFEWLEALLSTGIDQTAKNSKGKIPILCLYDISPYFMKRLHEAGMRLDMPTTEGNLINSILSVYSGMDQSDLTDVIEYLLQVGLDPNLPNEHGRHLIDYVQDSNLSLMLMKYGATPSEYSSDDDVKYKFVLSSADVLFNSYLKAKDNERSVDDIEQAYEHISTALRLDHNHEQAIQLAFKILAEIGDTHRTRLVMDLTIHDAFEYRGWRVGQSEMSMLNETMIIRKLNAILEGVRQVATEAYKRGEYDVALECFDMVYAQRQGSVPGSFLSEYHARLFANSIIKTKNEQDVTYISRIQEEAQRFPGSTWLRIMCGRILLRNEEYVVDAELEFRAAVELDKKGETTARFWLAESYLKQSLFDEAIEIALEDTNLRSKECDAWGQLGFIYASSGNLDDAYAAFRRSLDANPDYTFGQKQLARIEKILDSR